VNALSWQLASDGKQQTTHDHHCMQAQHMHMQGTACSYVVVSMVLLITAVAVALDDVLDLLHGWNSGSN
jgi:hypothetical protein